MLIQRVSTDSGALRRLYGGQLGASALGDGCGDSKNGQQSQGLSRLRLFRVEISVEIKVFKMLLL